MQRNKRNAPNPFCFPRWLTTKQIGRHLHVQPQLLGRAQHPQSFLPVMRPCQNHFVHESSAGQFRQFADSSDYAIS